MPGGQGKGAKAPTAKEFNERIEALQARLETEQAKTAEQKAIIDGQKAQLAQESARLEALRQSYHQNLTEEVAMQGQNNQVTLKSLQKELRDVYAKLVALETAIASLISGKRADPETGPPSLTANPPKKLKKEGTSVKLEGKDEQETPETLAQKQAAAALTAAQKDQVTALKSFILPHLCRFFGVLLACLDPNDVYADWIADYGFISLDNRHLRNAFEKECRPFCKKLVEIASDDEPIVVDGSSYQYKAETSSVVVGVQNESEGPRRKLLNPHIFLKVANAVHSADGEEVLEAGKIVAGLALVFHLVFLFSQPTPYRIRSTGLGTKQRITENP